MQVQDADGRVYMDRKGTKMLFLGEVSGSSSKRSRSDMDSSPGSVNIPTPPSLNVDTSTGLNEVDDINNRPEGREAAKKRKGKTTTHSLFDEEDRARLDGVRFATEAQVGLRQRRIEADLKIEEIKKSKHKDKDGYEDFEHIASQTTFKS
ncbi:hypothetical protein RND81_07G035800 [Saponaria officinalis]|uniref:Uncharacterized protein n=1 Tax=Saponaria officinalis TaxID=3572 RepID=A0AAW1JNE4_SAPOF